MSSTFHDSATVDDDVTELGEIIEVSPTDAQAVVDGETRSGADRSAGENHDRRPTTARWKLR